MTNKFVKIVVGIIIISNAFRPIWDIAHAVYIEGVWTRNPVILRWLHSKSILSPYYCILTLRLVPDFSGTHPGQEVSAARTPCGVCSCSCCGWANPPLCAMNNPLEKLALDDERFTCVLTWWPTSTIKAQCHRPGSLLRAPFPCRHSLAGARDLGL